MNAVRKAAKASAAGYFSESSPEVRWDYVVIGSGIGGMAAAAVLARQGKRVLVLEQHHTPGGYTHTFRRKTFEFDVGLHLVGEAVPPAEIGRLFEYLTDGALEWQALGSVYDQMDFPGGLHLEIPNHPDKLREELVAIFPEEATTIDRYFVRLRDARFAIRDYLLARTIPLGFRHVVDPLVRLRASRFFDRTTAEVLAELGASDRLARVLTAQWGYYGVAPSESSFGLHAIVARHYLKGAYYPVGGSARIAETMLRPLAATGGWTRTRASVEQILIERGRAVGVRLAGGEQIRARRVISAIGIPATAHHLLPAEQREAAWAREVRALEPSVSHFALYLGFEGDIRAAGATTSCRWFYNSWDPRLESWDVSGSGELPAPPLTYCSFASLNNPAHDPGPKQRHTGEVIAFASWQQFARWSDKAWQQRGDEYEALKERIADKMLDELCARLPDLRPMVAYRELSTPLSTDTFCRPGQGAIYGVRATRARFRCPWLRPPSPIPGLYFSGADVASPGVVGALIGGVLCALAAEPIGTLAQVRHLV